MSDTPDPTPAQAAAPPARNSPVAPPGPRRLDPAAVMIGVGGVVLLLALWWLLVTPRSTADGGVDPVRFARVEERLAALEGVRGDIGALNGRVQQLMALEGRMKTLEDRPAPPDIRPLEAQVTNLSERAAAAERGAAQAADRAAANERRLQELEARPVIDPAKLAPREAVDALSGRADRLAERIEAQAARAETQEAEQARRLQEAARQAEQREAAAGQQAQQRLAALEQGVQQRLAALDAQLGQRIAALEQAQQRLAAIEGRTARLAAVDALRASLVAGQPLGEALGRIDQAPPALARFAAVPPPTEASLRLSFEEAAQAARAASDAAMQPDGSRAGVVDSALSRLGGLVTIRRGDQVVWGDAAEAEIERARRALEAGDVEMSLLHLEKLPPPARAAMQPWADQARALLAARAALRQLAAG
ncbi:hypothetical protein GCM10011504_43620 [Siccirubricoccus deserti]|uniref:Uncharacterized protein n=1 Tax=Siccirubricoccus deserti TaxID=2013562 RepID=A0A9X0R1J5_9PROT|nr:hypothetical protein [Siccirubricoccus deserti]MBC4017625.1 hypothetical protein [Siccirubricoccus deserti]GGC60633.1 hypothetical protein GCM10011504_43620 [Siccirubricoccus deserti]